MRIEILSGATSSLIIWEMYGYANDTLRQIRFWTSHILPDLTN